MVNNPLIRPYLLGGGGGLGGGILDSHDNICLKKTPVFSGPVAKDRLNKTRGTQPLPTSTRSVHDSVSEHNRRLFLGGWFGCPVRSSDHRLGPDQNPNIPHLYVGEIIH